MPYTPAASFNYTQMNLEQIMGGGGSGGNSAATQGLDFARWAAGQGIDLINLARADRNSQLAVQNAFNQEQADRSYNFQNQSFKSSEEQRRLQNEAALRAEDWSKSLSNPAVITAKRVPAPAPDVQLYQAQLSEKEAQRKRLADYNTAHGWSNYNRY